MVTLATMPASITATNTGEEPLLVAGVRLEPSSPTVVPLDGRGDGNKSDIWTAFFTAQEAGLVTVDPVLTTLTDGVPSGHTLSGGHHPMGTITPET